VGCAWTHIHVPATTMFWSVPMISPRTHVGCEPNLRVAGSKGRPETTWAACTETNARARPDSNHYSSAVRTHQSTVGCFMHSHGDSLSSHHAGLASICLYGAHPRKRLTLLQTQSLRSSLSLSFHPIFLKLSGKLHLTITFYFVCPPSSCLPLIVYFHPGFLRAVTRRTEFTSKGGRM
jgi:hypothetical protein